jgi:hypothetical protein
MIAYKVDTVVTCAEPVEVSHSMAVDENTETLSLTGGLLTKGLGCGIQDLSGMTIYSRHCMKRGYVYILSNGNR